MSGEKSGQITSGLELGPLKCQFKTVVSAANKTTGRNGMPSDTKPLVLQNAKIENTVIRAANWFKVPHAKASGFSFSSIRRKRAGLALYSDTGHMILKGFRTHVSFFPPQLVSLYLQTNFKIAEDNCR